MDLCEAGDMNMTDQDHQKNQQLVVAKIVRYRECLKNHAAPMGGNATDGCGEFMPSGPDNTIDSFKCSACGCHRNFHRKETEGETAEDSYYHTHFKRYMNQRVAYQAPAMIMPIGAAAAMHTSESEEGAHNQQMVHHHHHQVSSRKRFRTKFTQEQKEKMLVFAEKVGWRLQRQEDALVQQFCQEIGVKRRVLKVWMHNNKHNLAKKTPSTTSANDNINVNVNNNIAALQLQ